jgi:hypothetical protein
MSISNDQTEQIRQLNKENPGSTPTVEEEAEQAEEWAWDRIYAADKAILKIKDRIEAVNNAEAKLPQLVWDSWANDYVYPSETLAVIKPYLASILTIIKSAAAAELSMAEKARVTAQKQVNLWETLYNRLILIEHKLDQVPIISTVVQEHGNTIDAMIDEDKSLRAKIRDLSDRLDFHERASKFICAAYNPTNLNEQAKEIYGALCPMEKHDEL